MKYLLILSVTALFSMPFHASGSANPWAYRFNVNAQDTRSETVSGKLLYDGKELPGSFLWVVTPIGEFSFTTIHGFSGDEIRWRPVITGDGEKSSRALTKGSEIDQALQGKVAGFRRTHVIESSEVLSSAPYLEGSLEKPPRGIGKNWFYVVKKGIWVNPKKIDDVIKLI